MITKEVKKIIEENAVAFATVDVNLPYRLIRTNMVEDNNSNNLPRREIFTIEGEGIIIKKCNMCVHITLRG